MNYTKENIEMIHRGANLYTDYTVVRMFDKAPLFILDKSKDIYDKLIGASEKQVNEVLSKCKLIEKPVIKETPRNENIKK